MPLDHFLLLDPLRPWMSVLMGFAAAALVFLPLASVVGMMGIWAERRVSARIQSRLGPNRVGPMGLLQSIADGVKVILKEDLIPDGADRLLFRLAPYLTFVPVFAAFVAIPFGPELVFEPRLGAGVFWLLAILSVEVIGVILAGWASNNKWSVYGAMREACQMVCYEIPLGLSIIIAVMTVGTLSLPVLGQLQGGGIHTWIVFRNPFVTSAFVVYFIAALASNKRAPFDLPESESELVAGYHTEYSGMRFVLFFFAEYAAMFVVAAVQVALYLGAWNDPFGWIGLLHARLTADPQHVRFIPLLLLNLLAAGIFIFKCILLLLLQMWVRWTLPRPRIDQVLYLCIKVLLPLACALLLADALWELFLPHQPGLPWVDYQPWSAHAAQQQGFFITWIVQLLLAAMATGVMLGLIGWIAHAYLTGRANHERLSEPEPIG